MGVVRGGQTHKLSLYADDLILYLSDPITSIPKALDIISGLERFQATESTLLRVCSSLLTTRLDRCLLRHIQKKPVTLLPILVYH